MSIATQDHNVLQYQETGNSDDLIRQYTNFLKKYRNLILYNSIDFTNYDIRYFLSCYIPKNDTYLRRSLRRGKYHSKEAVALAYKVLSPIRHKLRRHTEDELFHELVIPFLYCAKMYKARGVGFDKYLYKVYKYELKRHLDNIRWDALDHSGLVYRDLSTQDEWEEEIPEEFIIEMDEDFELSDPRWIHKDKSEEPFSSLKPHERYILVKYYYEEYTDREIARMLPYNPKSIHRIRMRLVKHFKDLYDKGEFKMSSTLKEFEEPIVAIACKDRTGVFHFLYCEKPIKLRDLDFQDELLRIGDFYLVYEWYNTVVVCTKETLRELKQELVNA